MPQKFERLQSAISVWRSPKNKKSKTKITFKTNFLMMLFAILTHSSHAAKSAYHDVFIIRFSRYQDSSDTIRASRQQWQSTTTTAASEERPAWLLSTL